MKNKIFSKLFSAMVVMLLLATGLSAGGNFFLKTQAQLAILPGSDLFETPEVNLEFGGGMPQIPADFFDPGSDPFQGIIQLQGEPLGGSLGDTTLIERRPAIDFGLNNPSVVPIEIVALNLVSIAPITVTYPHQNPEAWNVKAGLSPDTPSGGPMTITKQHANGGVFSSQFNVFPKLTFTRVSDQAVRVLEAPVPYQFQKQDVPWVFEAFCPLNILRVVGVTGGLCLGATEFEPVNIQTTPGPSSIFRHPTLIEIHEVIKFDDFTFIPDIPFFVQNFPAVLMPPQFPVTLQGPVTISRTPTAVPGIFDTEMVGMVLAGFSPFLGPVTMQGEAQGTMNEQTGDSFFDVFFEVTIQPNLQQNPLQNPITLIPQITKHETGNLTSFPPLPNDRLCSNQVIPLFTIPQGGEEQPLLQPVHVGDMIENCDQFESFENVDAGDAPESDILSEVNPGEIITDRHHQAEPKIMIAYPKDAPAGTQGHFPVVGDQALDIGVSGFGPAAFDGGSFLGDRDGDNWTGEIDADIADGDEDGLPNIDDSDQDEQPLGGDDGLDLPAEMSNCEPANVNITGFDNGGPVVFNPSGSGLIPKSYAIVETGSLFVNIFVDWNQDGDWNNGEEFPPCLIAKANGIGIPMAFANGPIGPAPNEWAVQNVKTPNLGEFSGNYPIIPFDVNAGPRWWRVILSDRPLDGGTVNRFGGFALGELPFEDGEISDFYLSPNDIDQDGVLNDDDNCEETPNPRQIDSDDDENGDVCDPCPGKKGRCDEGAVKKICPGGGNVTTGGDTATLEFPGGAVGECTDIGITSDDEADGDIVILASDPVPAQIVTQYTMTPSPAQFGQPVTITITYDDSNLPPPDESKLCIGTPDEEGVYHCLPDLPGLPDPACNPDTNTCTATTLTFSPFAVLGPLEEFIVPKREEFIFCLENPLPGQPNGANPANCETITVNGEVKMVITDITTLEPEPGHDVGKKKIDFTVETIGDHLTGQSRILGQITKKLVGSGSFTEKFPGLGFPANMIVTFSGVPTVEQEFPFEIEINRDPVNHPAAICAFYRLEPDCQFDIYLTQNKIEEGVIKSFPPVNEAPLCTKLPGLGGLFQAPLPLVTTEIPPHCVPNGVCNFPMENNDNCHADCLPTCGNGQCDDGEGVGGPQFCPNDCAGGLPEVAGYLVYDCDEYGDRLPPTTLPRAPIYTMLEPETLISDSYSNAQIEIGLENPYSYDRAVSKLTSSVGSPVVKSFEPSSFNKPPFTPFTDKTVSDQIHSGVLAGHVSSEELSCTSFLASTKDEGIFRVNKQNAISTFIGNGGEALTEIEYDSETGKLYGTTGGGNRRILEIDPVTGQTIFSVQHQAGAINGLESVDGVLYGTFIAGGGGPSSLVTVNPVTGNLTFIGLTGVGPISGLAFDPKTGIMYGVIAGGDDAVLGTISLATGVFTAIGPITLGVNVLDFIGSIEFGSDGKLYGVINDEGDTASNSLITIDTTTAKATLVGLITDGVDEVSGTGLTGIPCFGAGLDNTQVTLTIIQKDPRDPDVNLEFETFFTSGTNDSIELKLFDVARFLLARFTGNPLFAQLSSLDFPMTGILNIFFKLEMDIDGDGHVDTLVLLDNNRNIIPVLLGAYPGKKSIPSYFTAYCSIKNSYILQVFSDLGFLPDNLDDLKLFKIIDGQTGVLANPELVSSLDLMCFEIHPDEICADGLDNDFDGNVDENCGGRSQAQPAPPAPPVGGGVSLLGAPSEIKNFNDIKEFIQNAIDSFFDIFVELFVPPKTTKVAYSADLGSLFATVTSGTTIKLLDSAQAQRILDALRPLTDDQKQALKMKGYQVSSDWFGELLASYLSSMLNNTNLNSALLEQYVNAVRITPDQFWSIPASFELVSTLFYGNENDPYLAALYAGIIKPGEERAEVISYIRFIQYFVDRVLGPSSGFNAKSFADSMKQNNLLVSSLWFTDQPAYLADVLAATNKHLPYLLAAGRELIAKKPAAPVMKALPKEALTVGTGSAHLFSLFADQQSNLTAAKRKSLEKQFVKQFGKLYKKDQKITTAVVDRAVSILKKTPFKFTISAPIKLAETAHADSCVNLYKSLGDAFVATDKDGAVFSCTLKISVGDLSVDLAKVVVTIPGNSYVLAGELPSLQIHHIQTKDGFVVQAQFEKTPAKTLVIGENEERRVGFSVVSTSPLHQFLLQNLLAGVYVSDKDIKELFTLATPMNNGIINTAVAVRNLFASLAKETGQVKVYGYEAAYR